MQNFKEFPYKLWEELYIQSFVTDRTKTICLSPTQKKWGKRHKSTKVKQWWTTNDLNKKNNSSLSDEANLWDKEDNLS